MQEDSGQDAYQYFGVKALFTQMHQATTQDPPLQSTRSMKMPRKGYMASKFVRPSTEFSLHLFSPPQGGMGQKATTYCTKRLAEDMYTWKQQRPYSIVINLLRCKLSFAAIRSAIMCIRGMRSSKGRPIWDVDYITLATSEGCILLQD